MEDKNYRDEFEFFLKESADEFRMIPSRKVWYSIYNNMHPAKRWPSMAVCLFILTAVLYIGIENNNSLSNAAQKNASQNFTADLKEKKSDKNITFLPSIAGNLFNSKPENLVQSSTVPINFEETETSSTTSQNTLAGVFPNSENHLTNIYINLPDEKSNDLNQTNLNLSINNISKVVGKNDLRIEEEQTKIETSLPLQQENKINQQNYVTAIKETIAETPNDKDKALKNLLLITEKSWKEDYAFRNKPAKNKLKENGTLSYYVTPSIGYRVFSKKGQEKIPTATSNNFTSQSISTTNGQLDDAAALSLELGASFQYKVSKNIRIKTGIQANYTNYTSNATPIGHPSQIALAVNNYSSVYGVSNYLSAPGNTKLNKTTMQLAIPIGADIKVAGTGNFQLYVGSTLQPTYLIKGSAYVLSSDAEYYATDPGLLRKFNLNSAIETFISFKSSTGVTISVGPQFRYQLFSTYKKEYNYSEKLYNIGLKLGISTSF